MGDESFLYRPNDCVGAPCSQHAQRARRSSTYQRDMRLIRGDDTRAAKQSPQIIISRKPIKPEDAISDNMTRERSETWPRQAHIYSLVGTGYVDDLKKAAQFGRPIRSRRNAGPIVTISTGGAMGEWVTMRAWLPFGDVFHFPEQDVVAGSHRCESQGGRRSDCVPESATNRSFACALRARVAAGANLLVSITKDSWWQGESPAFSSTSRWGFQGGRNRRWFVAASTTD